MGLVESECHLASARLFSFPTHHLPFLFLFLSLAAPPTPLSTSTPVTLLTYRIHAVEDPIHVREPHEQPQLTCRSLFINNTGRIRLCSSPRGVIPIVKIRSIFFHHCPSCDKGKPPSNHSTTRPPVSHSSVLGSGHCCSCRTKATFRRLHCLSTIPSSILGDRPTDLLVDHTIIFPPQRPSAQPVILGRNLWRKLHIGRPYMRNT